MIFTRPVRKYQNAGLINPGIDRKNNANALGNGISSNITGMLGSSGDPASMVIGKALGMGAAANAGIQQVTQDQNGLMKPGMGNALASGFGKSLDPIGNIGTGIANLNNPDMNFFQKLTMFTPMGGITQQQADAKVRERMQQAQLNQNIGNRNLASGSMYSNMGGGNVQYASKGSVLFPGRHKHCGCGCKGHPGCGEVKKYRGGGAIILGGNRHADGGELGKGNPIINSETGEKMAETEARELLLNLAQTQETNGLIEKYNETQDEEILKQLGKRVRQIVLEETTDNSESYNLPA